MPELAFPPATYSEQYAALNYSQFIASRSVVAEPAGITGDVSISPHLFDFQHDIVEWAIRRGSASIFADCGMGKTPMQLEWARLVPGRVLIVAPLAVSSQTCREAEKFGVDGVRYMREDDGSTDIAVTNYEMIDRFDPSAFSGVVLDESSILKSYTGKIRNAIISRWSGVRFRLAASATPAPNDFMELGNHAEFMGAMSRTEMLAQFFVHDGGETQKWRLKGHAESEFWRWVCSWAVMIRKPSDLGYDDGGFVLPPLNINEITTNASPQNHGMLFAAEARTLQERRQARKNSIRERVNAVAHVANNGEPWVIWCDLNAESEALASAIDGAVEVRGSDSPEVKESRLIGFTTGKHRVIVTKPSIAGFGLNWQHCSNMAFTGLSDSYEQFYQAVRRCWRFGQQNEVRCCVVTDRAEGAVVKNIKRKEENAERMAEMMSSNMSEISRRLVRGESSTNRDYSPTTTITIPEFLK